VEYHKVQFSRGCYVPWLYVWGCLFPPTMNMYAMYVNKLHKQHFLQADQFQTDIKLPA
jgi:hypothetical protein